MRSALLFLGTAAVVFASARARAEAPPTFALHLDYALGPGAEACPGEARLHEEVARRVGYDPFAPESQGTPAGGIHAVIARSKEGLTATYGHVDAGGVQQWTRTYAVRGTGRRACEAAIEGMAVEIAVELLILKKKAPPPAPAPAEPAPAPTPPAPAAPFPAPAPAVPLPVPAEPAPPAPQAPPSRGGLVQPEVGLGMLVARGIAPNVTFGGVLHLGLAVFPSGRERPWMSFAFEGRIDKPASDRQLQAQLLAGSLLACGHTLFSRWTYFSWGAFACAVGTAGSDRTVVERAGGPLSLRNPYGGFGARLGLEGRFTSVLALRAYGDLALTVRAVDVNLSHRGEIWRTAGASGGGGIAAVLLF